MHKRVFAIGGLLLPADSAWKFVEVDGVIVGRRRNAPGMLQILHTSQDNLPQPLTHDFCLRVLQIMLKLEAEPTDRQMRESVCGPYGAATFLKESDVCRAWYCRRPPGLIYGVYICPTAAAHGTGYSLMSADCAHIMAEVLFDRIAWGSVEDPLTEVLINNFDRLENDRSDAPS